MSRMHKKFPPFGKKLAEQLKQGHIPRDIFLFSGGSSWQKAKNFVSRGLSALVLPEDESPDAFNWELVAGHEVLFIIASPLLIERIKRTAYLLLVSGAEVVRTLFLFGSNSMPAIYRRK